MSNEDTERRRFHRVLFDAPVRVSDGNMDFITTLVDVSLNGALLVRPDDWSIEAGAPVTMTILLDDNISRIRMQAETAHLDRDCIGLRCRSIDLESVSHLRRLVELNLGNGDLLERDLEALG